MLFLHIRACLEKYYCSSLHFNAWESKYKWAFTPKHRHTRSHKIVYDIAIDDLQVNIDDMVSKRAWAHCVDTFVYFLHSCSYFRETLLLCINIAACFQYRQCVKPYVNISRTESVIHSRHAYYIYFLNDIDTNKQNQMQY